MAEVRGLAANIVGIIQLVTQIAKLSYSYVCDVKNASNTQNQYLREVSALMKLLFRVERAIVDNEDTTEQALPRPPSLGDNVLMNCYQDLSGLHSELQKRKARFLRPFQDRELQQHIDTLQRFRTLFADYLSTCTLVTTNETYTISSFLTKDEDRDLLLTWIPKPNVSMRRRAIPCPGTGAWLLASEEFRRWISGSSELLWCYGAPGVGKSYLASTVVDHILRRSKESSVAYFFCDFSSQDQQTTLDILHCLLRQIIDQASAALLATLKYSVRDPSILQNPDEVIQLIAKVASMLRVYLILDAPDEAKDSSTLLTHIASLGGHGVQVLLASRDLPHIREKMAGAIQLEVRAYTADLRLFVESRIRESDFADDIDKDSDIIDNIVSKSGNIFLLACLILDEVLDLATVGQIRKALEREPLGLNEAFVAMMKRINTQSKVRSALARRLLSWMCFAKRRLKLGEIACAFAVEGDEEPPPENRPSSHLLLRICVGFVTVDQGDSTLGLVHASAYEFLKEGILSEEDANFDIAKTSLQYLLTGQLVNGPCKSSAEILNRFRAMEFLEYAAKNWGYHVSGEKIEQQLESLIIRLLGNKMLRDSAFQALLFRQEFAGESFGQDIFELLPSHQEALHVAAYWNLRCTVKGLLDNGFEISAGDSDKWTALHWACSRGHVATAEVLIHNGANVNKQDIQGWSPLFWAAFSGNLALVHLLLTNSADYLIRDTHGWTALHCAISGGHTEIVRELLEHHSRTKESGPILYRMDMQQILSYAATCPPVQVAANASNLDIFNLLVEHLQTPLGSIGDAEFNMIWSRDYLDPPVSRNLWRTMTKGEQIYGRMSDLPDLDEKNADGSNRWRSNPKEWKSVLLVSAIRDRQLSCMQLLLKAGADPNYHNALHVAAFRDDPIYAQRLLEQGADPTAYDVFGRTALHEAVMNGFIDTAAAIIRGGANVNQAAQNNPSRSRLPSISTEMYQFPVRVDGSTPLIHACGFLFNNYHGMDPDERGLSLQIVHLLLSNGADPNLCDITGRTALHYAVLRPFWPLIRALIDTGCLVDALDQDGRMPLHYLAMQDEGNQSAEELDKIVSLILQGRQGGSCKDLINCAIDKPPKEGVDNNKDRVKRKNPPLVKFESSFLNQASDTGSTPIQLALRGGRWKTVEVFLRRDASFPTKFDLNPILGLAIDQLEAHAVDLLIAQGARPTHGSVPLLIISYISKLRNKGFTVADIYSSFKRILRCVVAAGADINAREPDTGETALTIIAKSHPSSDALRDLLDLDADIYATSSEMFDPILATAIFGEADNLRCLLRHAELHPRSDHWSAYLMDVPQDEKAFTRMCSCLVKAGKINQTNNTGRTLLHLAAEHGNCQLITELLSHDARIDIEDNQGRLAIHCAGLSGNTTALQSLLSQSGYVASELASKENHSIAKILSRCTESNKTMFQLALEKNDIPLTRVLLQYGEDPNTVLQWRPEPVSALYYAADQGHQELVSLLLEWGATVNLAYGSGWQPLHVACLNGHLEIVKVLINSGADVHAQTRFWNTDRRKPSGLYRGNSWAGQPLHLAAMAGNPGIVQLLLDNGVNVHASTGVEVDSDACPSQGPTALHLVLDTGTFYYRTYTALCEERLQIAQWLVDRGLMVHGIIRRFSLQDILKFQKFDGLWKALVAGDMSGDSCPK